MTIINDPQTEAGTKRAVWTVAIAFAASMLLLGFALAPAVPAPERASSVIVQADSLARAEQAVCDVGGTITHRLGIIDAVAADIADERLDVLRSMDGIRRVSGNRAVETAGKPPKSSPTTTTTSTFRDEFNVVSYGNNDGTQPWLAPWEESNDDGSPASGNVHVAETRLYLDNKDGGSLESIHRAADVSGASSATLSFNFDSFGEGGLDIVAVEVSTNGGASFTQLESIEVVGNIADGRTYVLEQFITLSDNVVVRFRIVQGFAATTQYVGFDDVQIAIAVGESSDVATGNEVIDSLFPTLVEADRVHAENNLGWESTIAVLDTGVWKHEGLASDYSGAARIDAVYNARDDTMIKVRSTTDDNGHGSHITSVVASSLVTNEGLYNGIAPGAGILSIVAFDAQGNGTYADVIRGIDFAVSNVGWIRVLNLSIGAPVQSHYWDDPLNQAVMRAWEAGLVVVTSAGNTGSDPQSITVPANVPYVITVGAMTDGETVDAADDRLTRFSAAGPTYEGFVKPEVVAPGGHMLGLMKSSATLPMTYPEFYDGGKYFTMSGTSQAAAVVSGVVALMLTADPSLTPDDVKCRLLDSARPFVNNDGTLAYSVFQQGAGVINAYDAVHSTAQGCANQGLDINLDLSGVYHYGGRANQDADGNYYLMGLEGDGYTWDGMYDATQGFVFSDAFVFSDGFVFSDAFLFTDGTVGSNGHVWTDGFVFSDGYNWTNGFVFSDVFPFTDTFPFTDAMAEPMSVNVWVDRE